MNINYRTSNSVPACFCIVVLLGIVTAEALASSMWCERPHPRQVNPIDWAQLRLTKADTIILGRVYSIKEVEQQEQEPSQEKSDGANSMADLLRQIEAGREIDSTRYDHVVSFEVIKAWKDPIHPIVRTKVNLGRLKEYQSFREGDIYLVVGSDLDGTLYRIEIRCLDAIREEWAGDYIAALDALTSGN